MQPQEAVENMVQEEAPKKKRGRPRKIQPQEEIQEMVQEESILPGFDDEDNYEQPVQPQVDTETINLFDLGNDDEEEIVAPEPMGGIILPGFDDEDDEPI